MAIKFHTEHAIYDNRTDTIRVPAVDDNKLVICAITHDAIHKAVRYEDGSVTFLLDAYRRFRLAFHIIANHKFRSRRIESDGVVLVVPEDFAALDSVGDDLETDTRN